MNDPRTLPDFDPSLYPLSDQKPAPPNTNAAAARQLEFLAAYYHINQAHRTLLNLRAESRPADEERAALQAIERALLARDALEDKYAPLGIVATPQLENGFIKNVSFVQPPGKVVGSSLSMLFAVGPLPASPR